MPDEMTDAKCPNCGTKLSEHPANRCLDAWVAESKGWIWIHHVRGDGSPDTNRPAILLPAKNRQWLTEMDVLGDGGREREIDGCQPRYCSDISAAMGLLSFDSIGEGPWILLFRGNACDSGPQWHCIIRPREGEGRTPAEAISKAYIAYKESQDGE